MGRLRRLAVLHLRRGADGRAAVGPRRRTTSRRSPRPAALAGSARPRDRAGDAAPQRPHRPARCAGADPHVPRHRGAPPTARPIRELWVAPGRFTSTMQALARAGYHATTLGAVWRAWHGHGTMPRHPIIVSFDDGYQSQSTAARRALAPSRLARRPQPRGRQRPPEGRPGARRGAPPCCATAGRSTPTRSPTPTSPRSTPRGCAARWRARARWLRHAFGVPVAFFAYPAGRYDPRAEAAVRAAGYDGATTTQAGIASLARGPLRPAAPAGDAADDAQLPTSCAPRARMTGTLRRARAAAQLLHRPRAAGVAEVVGHLLAVQAQDLRAARLALRARTRGSSPADVDAALTDERSVVVAWLMRGTLHLVGRDDYPWLLGLTAPTRLAASRRRLGQEGVAPGDAERAVKIVERALADDGPLTRPELAERIAAAGIRTEGQATPHLLMLAALRGIAVLGPLRDDGAPRLRAHARLARRRAAAELDGRRSRRRAGRARPPLPRRPRPRGARRPRHLERPPAARRARRAAGDRLRAGRARRRPRRPRRARPRARGDPRAPAARLRPLPAGLEGPRLRRPRPPREARPSRRRDAARDGDRRRARRRHLERRGRRGELDLFGRVAAEAKAALRADADDVARFVQGT